MDYPDYKYFDTAVGGWQNRNQVSDKLTNYIGKMDTGRTYFRFGRDYLEHFQANNSVTGFRGKCYADFIPIDIDLKDDINGALDITKNFLHWLEAEFQVSPDQIPVWFSGAKGTHLALPILLFGDIEPSEDLPERFHHIVDSFGDWGFDLTIYDKNRLLRLENTINSKTGLYKIRIMDPFSISEKKLLKLAKKVGEETTADELSDVFENDSLINIFNSFTPIKKAEEGKKESDVDLRALLKTGVTEGSRNKTAFDIARHLKYIGNDREITHEILCNWNQKNNPPLIKKELKSVIKSAFSKDCKKKKEEKKNHVISKVYKEVILETCYDPDRKSPYFFAKYEKGKVDLIDVYDHNGELIYPMDDPSGIVPNKALYLPTQPVNYGNEAELVDEIKAFIHKYVAVSPTYESLAAYYVLFTWVFDRFNVLPYLRIKGDTGTGKSTFLYTIGPITYKPTIVSGALTPAPVFRLIEMIKGTLIIDEADFDRSDTKNEIVKILNCGFQNESHVIRCNTADKSHDIMFFDVFGPKIIGTREEWRDRALENRCLTEDMNGRYRVDIKQKVRDEFEKEAEQIRNKLLMFRFRNYHQTKWDGSLWNHQFEPRLNQVCVPIMSIIKDSSFHSDMKDLMERYNQNIIKDRQSGLTGIVVEVIVEEYYKFFKRNKKYKPNQGISISKIAKIVNEEKANILDPGLKVTPQLVGNIIKKYLNLRSEKTRDGMILPYHLITSRIDYICERFGLKYTEGKKAKKKKTKQKSKTKKGGK